MTFVHQSELPTISSLIAWFDAKWLKLQDSGLNMIWQLRNKVNRDSVKWVNFLWTQVNFLIFKSSNFHKKCKFHSWQHCIFSPFFSLQSFILFDFFLENSVVASTECRSPWIHLSNGKWYQSSENPMSFAKVNTFCQSIGGRVAEVSSVDDYWSIKFHLGKP